jgi:hypothetical protein
MEPPDGDAFGPPPPPAVGASAAGDVAGATLQPPLPPAYSFAVSAPFMPSAPFAPYGSYAPVNVLPPVSEAVLKIPLGTRELIRQALDLLTRSDSGLRGPSFYIGFLLLVTFGPLAVILGMILASGQDLSGASSSYGEPPPTWLGWMLLAFIPAFGGLIAAGAEASGLATAVIGGRVEGRPLRIRESIAIARRRFWSILGPRLLMNFVSGILSTIVTVILAFVVGFAAGDVIGTGVGFVIALIVSAPFVYVPSGVVLGEVGAGEAISRSFKLVMLRKRLAIVITLFGVFSQFIVTFGLSAGVDAIGRVLIGAGLTDNFPMPLVVPIAAALVFALGTLTFLVEAIAAAPAVHAFAALTHYTHGLEVGRREPVRGRHLWDPWVTPGLAAAAVLGLLVMIGGVATLAGAT